MCGKGFRVWIAALAACLIGTTAWAQYPFDEDMVLRGDANNDQRVNASDAVYINNWLYSGGPKPTCMNQADVNDDGIISLADSTYLWDWLYSGGPAPPPPGPVNPFCNPDPTEPYLGCVDYMCRHV